MSKVRELAHNAKEQTAAISLGAREKVQGVLQDAGAVKELKQGITELEALPEDGSILYKMDLETMINDLSSLMLIIKDSRLDDGSVEEEIRKVMNKVGPAEDTQPDGPAQDMTDEQKLLETARSAAYNACTRALEALGR